MDNPVESRQHTSLHHAMKKPNNNLKMIVAIVVAIVIILVGGLAAYALKSMGSGVASTIDNSKYQALFLTSGQVYFGKLQALDSGYFKLTDIYYLQSDSTSNDSDNPQQTNSDTNANVQLIKLGNEIHGPEDEMVVAKDQVIFFENLQSSGKVSKSIAEYQKSHK